MADAQTVDLFEGLPLDYNFLEGDDVHAMGPTETRDLMSAAPAPTGSFSVHNDQRLLDSDVPGSSPTNMMVPKAEGEDLLTPLSFSFHSNGASSAGGLNYRVASQHKHKRVRSNPDVLQGFGIASMALHATTPSVMGSQTMRFPSQQKVMPIGPVQVEPSVNSIPLGGTTNGQGELFQEMDEFLMGLPWSELSPDQLQQLQVQTSGDAKVEDDGFPNGERTPVAYRSQRIQDGVNELKMKRKRSMIHHSRHHSNPVDLLHNLDQFRVMAEQQNKQLEQNMNVNHYGAFPDPTAFLTPSQSNMQQFHFQVPPQIASGAVHSLHSRRSSLGSNLPQRAAARRRCGSNRSSGLSMDMSHMNLGFLSVPEEPSMANSNFSPPRHSSTTSASSSGSKKNNLDDANRKLYKCGRCGQPKVGHICTMPDQRNNWTQVDLQVTKGLKTMRINCHILPVKSKWKTQCDNHEQPQLARTGDIKREEEVEAEPRGL